MEVIRAGGMVRLCSLGHFIPSFICQAARARYDCVWIDLEHRAMSLREVQALLIACHLYDIDAMVRVPTREKTELYRYLEDGAAGLMIPHVSTVQEARDLVRSTKFPPLGERGFDNAGLDSDYYLHDIDDYAAWARAETFLTVQIETPEAVENVEDIAAVEGVDILFVGPGISVIDTATTIGEMPTDRDSKLHMSESPPRLPQTVSPGRVLPAG